MSNRIVEKQSNLNNLAMHLILTAILISFIFPIQETHALSDVYGEKIYDTGELKPIDSELKVKLGEKAPDFTLKATSGKSITLSDFRGKQNVLLSFIPAAWTPVCSDQWPGYNIAKPLFEQHDTILLGISVDNLPTLHAWITEMGSLWFEVLSDFWPHGAVAESYGVLRTDGVTERALFLIDKQGVLQFIHVGDINVRPELGAIVEAMEMLKQ